MEVIITEKLDESNVRELGNNAVWTLSSAKPGNGIEQLRDDSTETYWQSDGAQPHMINIQFLRKETVSKICIHLDYSSDESYTPKKIAIRSGTSLHDLIDLTAIELQEPVGWVSVILNNADENSFLRTHFIQIKVLTMHQNGRDTHIRQIKVFGPRTSPKIMGNLPIDSFKTVDMLQYAVLR